jgi:hypothetical protein
VDRPPSVEIWGHRNFAGSQFPLLANDIPKQCWAFSASRLTTWLVFCHESAVPVPNDSASTDADTNP